MSESNLPPERWRPLFDRAGIEFGYRPLAARAGLTHTRVHRLIRGGGTTAEAIEQVAEALGVKASKIRELRDEPADPDPFTLPDDAGRLTHDERDVIRAMVRALLDARDRHDQADQSSPDSAGSSPAPRAPGTEVEKSNVRDLMRRGSSPATEPEELPEELPEDAWAARTRDPRFKPDIPEDDGVGEENQDDSR